MLYFYQIRDDKGFQDRRTYPNNLSNLKLQTSNQKLQTSNQKPQTSNHLERVTDGEVEGLSVAEFRYVVESALAGIVGQVDTDTPVETYDEEIEVVT